MTTGAIPASDVLHFCTAALRRRLLEHVCHKLFADIQMQALHSLCRCTCCELRQIQRLRATWGMHGPGLGQAYLLLARRFSSEKLLPCNCGAVRCRGFVNAPERDSPQTATIWAPSVEVQPWREA